MEIEIGVVMYARFDPGLPVGMVPTLYKEVLDEFEIKEALYLDLPSKQMKDPYSENSQTVEQSPQDIQNLDDEELGVRWEKLNKSMRTLANWFIEHSTKIAERKEFRAIRHKYNRTMRSYDIQRESVIFRTLDRLEGIFLTTDPHAPLPRDAYLPPVPTARVSPLDGRIVRDAGEVEARPLTLAAAQASSSLLPQGLQEVKQNKSTVLQLLDTVPKIIEYLKDDTVPHYEKITNAAWILQKSDQDCPRGVVQLFDTILQESKLRKLAHLIAQFRGEICDALVTEHMYSYDIPDGVQVHFRAELITLANARNWNIPDPRQLVKMDTQEERGADKDKCKRIERFFIASLSDSFRYRYNLIGGIHFLEKGFLERIKKLCRDRGITCESRSDRLQLSQYGLQILTDSITCLARSHQMITVGEDLSSCSELFSLQLQPQYEDIVDEGITSLNSDFTLQFLTSVAELPQVCPTQVLYIYPELQLTSSQKRYVGKYMSSGVEKTIYFEYSAFDEMNKLIVGRNQEEIKRVITSQLFIRVVRRDVLKWSLLRACINHNILRSPKKDAEITSILQGFATSSPVVAQIKNAGKDCNVCIYFVNGNNDSGVCAEDPYRGILLCVEEEGTQKLLDINTFDLEQFETVLRAILHGTLESYLNSLRQLYASKSVEDKMSAHATLEKERVDYCCITLCWYTIDFCLKLISRYHIGHFSNLLTKPYLGHTSISNIFMMLFTLKFASSFFSNVYERDLSKLTHKEIKGALEFYAVARNDMPLWDRVQTLHPEGPVWSIFPISLPVKPTILIEKFPSQVCPYVQVRQQEGNDVFGDYILQITAFGEEVYVSSTVDNRQYTQKISEEAMPFYREVLDRNDPKDISTPALACMTEHIKELSVRQRCHNERVFGVPYWVTTDCPWNPRKNSPPQMEWDRTWGRFLTRTSPLPVRKFSVLIPTEMLPISSFCVNRMSFLQKIVKMIEGSIELQSRFECKSLKNSHTESELDSGREGSPPPVDVIFRKRSATSSQEEWEKIEALQEAITLIPARRFSEPGPLESIRRAKDPVRVFDLKQSSSRAYVSGTSSSSEPSSKRRRLCG